jgi:predicted dehydrogenase
MQMSKRTLNVGVVGAGMIGAVHVNCLQRDGRSRVLWLADTSAEMLEDRKQRFGIPRVTADYREMLEDPTLDAVVVATPPHCHFAIARDALRAGKHVLLEKPMVCVRADLARLERLAAQYPKLVLLDCSCRHSRLQPKFEFVRKLIQSGAIGRVYHIHHQHIVRTTFLDWNPKGTWARSKAQAGGGPLFDWGVYDLAFHLGVLGDVPQLQRLRSFTIGDLKAVKERRLASDVEQHAAVWMEYSGGLTYYYERGAGAHLEAANETRISGTKGGLRFSFPSWEPAQIEVFSVDGRGKESKSLRRVVIPRGHDDNQALTRHFIDCVLERRRPEMPLPLAAKHLRIIFSMFAAPNAQRSK